jgi:hypothetical protein
MGIGLVPISFQPKLREPILRVVFENVSPVRHQLLLGGMTGIGPMHNLKFTATAPDGTEREIFNAADVGFVAGYLSPLVASLAPGETHEIQFPLWKFFYVKQGVDIRLETLLDRGYSVRVSLEVDADGARWAGVPIPWLGKLTSGEFRSRK